MGYFGNIWVRSHYFAKAGDTNGGGHYHHHDHVTLLAVGEVLVEMDGKDPKKFTAPTFIVVPADHKHKFTALTDGVVYYCVYALRDENGEVDVMFNGDHSPYTYMTDGQYLDRLLKRKQLERHYNELCKKYGEKRYDEQTETD